MCFVSFNLIFFLFYYCLCNTETLKYSHTFVFLWFVFETDEAKNERFGSHELPGMTLLLFKKM